MHKNVCMHFLFLFDLSEEDNVTFHLWKPNGHSVKGMDKVMVMVRVSAGAGARGFSIQNVWSFIDVHF